MMNTIYVDTVEESIKKQRKLKSKGFTVIRVYVGVNTNNGKKIGIIYK